MPKTYSLFNQYIILIMGSLLLLLGTIILSGVIHVTDPSLWLPAMLIFTGLFLLPASSRPVTSSTNSKAMHRNPSVSLIALGLLCVGAFLIMREFGIITIPWLRYALGGSLIVIGLYGIFLSAVHIKRTHNATPNV